MKHNRATNPAKKITRYLAGIAAATLLITGMGATAASANTPNWRGPGLLQLAR